MNSSSGASQPYIGVSQGGKPYKDSRYTFGEAFMLMWYGCNHCGHRELIWNSRDGITPFGMDCPSCGHTTLRHVHWDKDLRMPHHKLHRGQRFWRDGAPADAEAIMIRRLDSIPADSPYHLEGEERQRIIDAAKSGSEHEFAPGWPMLDIYLGEKT